MTAVLSQPSDLENVIAATIWRRVAREDGTWEDLRPGDREEFELDAQAVLEAMVAAGYKPPEQIPDTFDDDPVDILAREAMYQMVLTDRYLRWVDFPTITKQDQEAIGQRLRQRAEADKPTRAALIDAYEYLVAKASP